MSHIITIERHSTHEVLSQCIQIVSEARAMENVVENEADLLDRIHYVLHIFENALKKADPYLVPISVLDNANSHINSISSYAKEYKRSRTKGQLEASLGHIDTLCTLLRSIYIPNTPDEIENVKEATVSFRQSLSQHLRYASKEADELTVLKNKVNSEITDLRKSIETEKNRVDGIATEFQRQFSVTQQDRITDFSKNMAEFENKFNLEISKFNTLQEETFKGFNQGAHELINKSSKSTSDLIDSIKERHTDIEVEAQFLIDKLESFKIEGQGILGQMSIDGHAAAYKDEADRARKMKHIWHWLTGGFFIALIGSALWNAMHVTSDASLTTIASKWVATLAISAAVTYFARQAAKQDIVERDNRYMQLQLATIDPYLLVFEESERKEVKKQLVDRIFTGVRNGHEVEEKSAGIPTEDLVKIFEAAAKITGK